MKRLKGIAIAASLLMLTAVSALPAAAGMTTIYGTVNIGNFDRDGHDKDTKHRFSAPVEGPGVIVIRSTPPATTAEDHHGRRHNEEKEFKKDNTFRKVKIEFNGEEVVSQRHFEKGVEELRYDVPLLASNTMKVKVKGCKKCSLQLSVLGNSESGSSQITAPPVPPPPPPF